MGIIISMILKILSLRTVIMYGFIYAKKNFEMNGTKGVRLFMMAMTLEVKSFGILLSAT